MHTSLVSQARHTTFATLTELSWRTDSERQDKNVEPLAGQHKLWRSSGVLGLRLAKGCAPKELLQCIGRESNPGLAESLEMISLMATANFTTKPPMLDERESIMDLIIT